MKTLIFCTLNALVLTASYANDGVSKPPGVIESPYEACRDVTIVAKDKYQENAEKWKAWEIQCQKKVQVSEQAGISRLSPLNDSAQYLTLATKVAEKVMNNLEKSQNYAQCARVCFMNEASCSMELTKEGRPVNCSDRRAEILKGLKIHSRKARMELALSQGASDITSLNVRNILTLEEEKRINKNLRDFEVGPNPVGRTQMQPREIEHAKGIIKRERAKVEQDYKAMLTEKAVKHSPELYNAWISKALMDKIEEHQRKYRQIVYEESPLLAVIDRPVQFDKGDEPVWSDKQLADAFSKLVTNAKNTKASVKASIEEGKLEFGRANGEAFKQWLLQLVPGTKDNNELLYYMGMKNQVEEVLKEDKSMCGAATSLSDRLLSKEVQNIGVVFAGTFVGPVVAKGTMGIFRIGRALTGAEAAGVTGLAIGSAFLGDSFREYNTIAAETSSGVAREAKDIEYAKTNVALNLVFAPILAPTGWGLGKILYSSLGKQMAKDLPEVSKLMKKAGTNQAVRDEAVDKWMVSKVKAAIKNKVIGAEDEALLKSEAGGKILDMLAADIQKNNPKFFNDPKNFDFFLVTAAKSLKKQPGDPSDLGEKSRHLFLSFSADAFQSWDPKARQGLMRVFNEGVEELRLSYSKDPATYAKFTTDPDSQEKIMIAALKRAGVADDAEIAAMKKCALPK